MTLTEIRRRLTEAGIEDARWEARLLAERYTGLSAACLMSMDREELSAPGLKEAVTRRCLREPLQYILGEWPFMGLDFAVCPDCLIPRPDTETLVEEALRHLPEGARVADLCTGSGCIGISLAHFRPDITVIGVDLSEKAVTVARHNGERLGVAERFTVMQGDVTADVFSPEERFDCIVANPPYIALNEMETLAPELSFEPRMALTDEGDGLSVIRGVLSAAARFLSEGGTLLMEFGSTQGEAVMTLAREQGFCGEILRDCGGNDRVLLAWRV